MFASCRSSKVIQKNELREQAVEYLANPAVKEISGKITLTSGNKGPFTLKIKMRWNDCIHISYSVLGLMEVASVDILPRKVVIVNSLNDVYCEMKYSDIPYIGIAKIDFRTIQGLLWDRMFVYGQSDILEASSHIEMLLKDRKSGKKIFTDNLSDFRFEFDDADRLTSISKSGVLYKAFAGYSGFTDVSDGLNMPDMIDLSVTYGKKYMSAQLRYSGLSKSSTRGEIYTDVSSLAQISFDDMLKIIKKYL